MPTPRSWATRGLDATALASLSEGLSGSQLWSLLLTVMEERARARSPADVAHQWQTDGFVRPASVSQRLVHRIDGELFAAAEAFEAIELSPLAPLSACVAVAPTSQNRIVSTMRGTEVVSDPTNVLALLCAERLRAAPSAMIRLATSHRCVRAQPVPKGEGYAPHFRMFALGSAGLERQAHAFTIAAMLEHIHTHLSALARLSRAGFALDEPTVQILATAERHAIAEQIVERVRGASVSIGSLEHRYYHGLRFLIRLRGREGERFPLVDGGAFDWVAKLNSNERLVYVASGLASQLIGMLAALDSVA